MSSLAVVLRVPPLGEARVVTPTPATVGSPATSSADEDASDDQRQPPKKRKSSYRVRKEEMAKLRDELVQLRGQFAELKTRDSNRQTPLMASVGVNEALRARLSRARLAMAGAQSLISDFTCQLATPPIGCFIHLPVDADQRQRIVDSLKAQKMREALEFMLARCQFHDLRRPRRQVESCEAENGDQIVVQWEMATIEESEPSVERVFEEMIEFARTHEMTLAEEFGIVAVRESDICSDATDSTQLRGVSAHKPNGRLVEKNIVLYSQYYPRSDLLDEPHGLLVMDYVDQDDAYPYRPYERVRRDISSVSMVVQCPPSDSGVPGAVALLKWAFVRVHRSPLTTADELEDLTSEGSRTFFSLMVRSIRERLVWQRG